MSLSAFFEHARDMLRGDSSVEQFVTAIGEGGPTHARVGFYRVLVRRNMDKILREGFPTIHALCRARDADLWPELVDAFTRAHPAHHRVPNRFCEPFSAFLAARREVDPRIDETWEELADFHWLEFACHTAPDAIPEAARPDGLDHRLYVRQYSRRIPEYAAAVRRDVHSPCPEPAPTPTIIYRHEQRCRVRVLYPSVHAFAVLARRRGDDPSCVVPGLAREQLDAVEQRLLEAGVLMPSIAGDQS